MQYHFMDELCTMKTGRIMFALSMLVCGAYMQISLQTGYRSYGYGGLGNYGSYYKLLKQRVRVHLFFLCIFSNTFIVRSTFYATR